MASLTRHRIPLAETGVLQRRVCSAWDPPHRVPRAWYPSHNWEFFARGAPHTAMAPLPPRGVAPTVPRFSHPSHREDSTTNLEEDCRVNADRSSPRVRARRYRQAEDSMIDAARMFGLLDLVPDVTDAPGAPDLSVSGGTVEFDRVCFSYDPSNASVLPPLRLLASARAHTHIHTHSTSDTVELDRTCIRLNLPSASARPASRARAAARSQEMPLGMAECASGCDPFNASPCACRRQVL